MRLAQEHFKIFVMYRSPANS